MKNRLYRYRQNRDVEPVINYVMVGDGDTKHKREQIETDLIGVHWLATRTVPWDRF